MCYSLAHAHMLEIWTRETQALHVSHMKQMYIFCSELLREMSLFLDWYCHHQTVEHTALMTLLLAADISHVKSHELVLINVVSIFKVNYPLYVSIGT